MSASRAHLQLPPLRDGAMHEFLTRRLDTHRCASFTTISMRCGTTAPTGSMSGSRRRASRARREQSSVWTVCYDKPSRYNWMLQYYPPRRRAGLELDRTGQHHFQLELYEQDFAAVADRFVAAARAMHAMAGGGWMPGRTAPDQAPDPGELIAYLLKVHRRATPSAAGSQASRAPAGFRAPGPEARRRPLRAERVPHRVDQLARIR